MKNSLEDISDNDNDSSITISTKKKKIKVKKLSVLDSGVTSDESESELNKKSHSPEEGWPKSDVTPSTNIAPEILF